MRQIACAIALLVLLPTAALPPQPAQTLDELKGQAEKSYSEKSFGRAHELYEQASRLPLPPAEKRWVELRLADTAWRTEAANPGADSTVRDRARQELERLIGDARDNHDRVWAEANESLGDYWWTHPSQRNAQAAQPWYVAALEWWAGSSDIAVARRRYLDIVFRMALPNQWEPGENGRMVPREVLVSAISIAESREDRVHAQYLLATQLMSDFTPATVERTLELLEAVIRDGKGMPWYDDALYAAASRYVQPGAVTINDDGATVFKPDFEKALALYRRIVTEFAESETRYYGEAKRALDEIIAPSVGVAASSTFLPKSEQQVILMWRNVKQVELTLTPVDLVDDVRLSYSNFGNWADATAAGGRAPLRRWTYTTNDTGDRAPKSEPIRIAPKLDPGAYLITASANGKTARQILLVTDVTIVTHTAGPRTDYFVCDAVTGQPVSGARVRIWQQKDQNNVPTLSATTNASGYATTSFKESSYGTIFIAASAPEHRQAWLNTWNYGNYRENQAQWRIYAFTDRPAYRPDETVQWKFVARVRNDNEWVTPAKETIDYEIRSPRGEQVSIGKATLNEFGTFWSDLPLNPAMALGAYTITFTKLNAKNQTEAIGNAQLFRLEEYKLPEFRVEVKTPEENGKRKQYRLGDTVEAAIEANYYFGGPVANATVQVVVRSAPFYQYWYPWREYGWYYDSRQPRYDRGQEIRNETVKTDAQGRAVVRIDTSPDAQNTELTIEARVTDASRREVVGQGFVKVMRQRYSVVAQPAHYVHRPNEKVSITFKAMDANEQPVQATGKVKVFRRAWEDVTKPRFIGYREEEILTTTATTDASGEATISFNGPGVGYYTVRWASEDRDPKSRARARDIVNAETSVWVTNTAANHIGYHTSGGIEIIVDKETFRSGQTAAVLIATPASGRWIMLTTSANGILDTQIVRLDGNVKLVQLPITDRNVPVFYITASSVSDRVLATVAQRVVVPPVEHFIDVEVKPGRDQYEPREEGTFVITTRTVDGKPIAAEVAVSVSDESVTAIQSEIAGDPRQFFFGADNAYPVQAAASVQMQQYVVLSEEKGKLIDERELDAVKKRGDAQYAFNENGQALPSAPAAALMGEAMGRTESKTVADAMRAQSGPLRSVGAKDNIEVKVRSDFRSTAFWKPDVITGKDGVARVSFKFPEALTTWRATARAVTSVTQVGMGSATARTNMPLIVRLQAPRFFVAGDRATVSAVINNNTDVAMLVAPSIEVEGVRLAAQTGRPPLSIPPHGEARADWIVSAEKPGNAKLRVSARSTTRGDAMEKTFTVYEHGIDKLMARSGKLRGEEAIVKLDLPSQRRQTMLTVQIQPSLAVTMLDALPYLIDYPYGCTEQTMSRFLPAAIVARTLAKNGLDPKAIESRMFGGIEKKSGTARLGQLEEVTAASMRRLYDFQHGDGGWGWWKEGDSDDFMTAYVVWGFSVAREGGLRVDENAVERAVAYLDQRLVKHESQWADQAWILHALAEWRAVAHDGQINAGESRAFDDAFAHRDRLTAYSRALLAIAAHDFRNAERAGVLLRNLEDGVKIDSAPDASILVRGSGANAAETMATAHWGEDRFWWHWYDGPVESTAFALQAFMKIDPQNKLVEPVMNWLVKNRRGAQWNNTRDTAIAILALDDYLQQSHELGGDVSYELSVNGRVIASKRVSAADVLGAPARFAIDADLVRDANEIRIRRTGGRAAAPIYFAAEARFVSLEEPVKAAGNEIFVRREYFRLASRTTLLKGTAYDRLPLPDNGSMLSGERVEVVVSIEAKNDYDYLLLEDLKPAGLEAIALQSGTPLYATAKGRSVWVYQELRDRKVAMFIDHLPQGMWEIRYTLRAEVPGFFHALPLLGQAMYVPEIRANGEEVRLEVQ